MKKVLIIVVLLAIAGVVGTTVYKRAHRTSGPLVLYGNVDIREVNLGFRAGGKLQKLFFDEGDHVKAGQVLAQLDEEPYRNKVASAKAQVEAARARLELRQAGNRPQEIAQARALVHEREVTMQNAERFSKRMEELVATKGVAAQDRDNAQAAYEEAVARLGSARENLALLEVGFRKEEVAQAKADLSQAEAALAGAELDLKDTTLTAPADGVILTRAQEAGAILAAGTTVFTLSLENPVWVRAYVNERDMGHIHPGTQVRLSSDTEPNKSYEGQVGFISPRAEFTPKTVETPELRTTLVYRLRIVVSNADQALRQGMPVTIRLTER